MPRDVVSRLDDLRDRFGDARRADGDVQHGAPLDDTDGDADALTMTPEQRANHEAHRAVHYRRIVQDGKIYSQPFSEGGAAAAGKAPWGTLAKKVDGGYIVNGKKIFASLSGSADYYGALCTRRAEGEEAMRLLVARQHLPVAILARLAALRRRLRRGSGDGRPARNNRRRRALPSAIRESPSSRASGRR